MSNLSSAFVIALNTDKVFHNQHQEKEDALNNNSNPDSNNKTQKSQRYSLNKANCNTNDEDYTFEILAQISQNEERS